MPHPQKLPLRFFRWFCHRELRNAIEGDLGESFRECFHLKTRIRFESGLWNYKAKRNINLKIRVIPKHIDPTQPRRGERIVDRWFN